MNQQGQNPRILDQVRQGGSRQDGVKAAGWQAGGGGGRGGGGGSAGKPAKAAKMAKTAVFLGNRAILALPNGDLVLSNGDLVLSDGVLLNSDGVPLDSGGGFRSEERRVGKECRS